MKSSSRQAFDASVEAIFYADNPDAQSLLSYIQRLLYLFRLHQAYEVKDVLIEVYTRGVKLTEESEQVIEKPLPWIRRTALNVIREYRRELDRVKYDDLDRASPLVEDALSDMITESDLRALRSAFKRLEPEERNILHLRVVNQMSWRDIGNSLVSAGEVRYSENALRQRGYRALVKLRKIYEKEREDIYLDWNENKVDTNDDALKK